MIKICNKKDINNYLEKDVIIIVPSYLEYYYKEKFIDNNYKIFTLKNYLYNVFNNKYKRPNRNIEIIFLINAINKIKESLSYYNDINNDLLLEIYKTYDEFYEYDLINNSKTCDLKLIFDEYEKKMFDNYYLNEHMLYKYASMNLNLDKTYLFLGFDDLSNDELNILSKINTGYFFIDNSNKNLINKLSKTNSDIDVDIYSETAKKIAYVKACNDVQEEVQYVLNDISDKLLNGASYKDFIIVSNDTTLYEPYFNLLFNISYSKKETDGILTSRFIKLFKNIIAGDFSCDNFINLLKLNIYDVKDSDINLIDNYVYEWDLENEVFYKAFSNYKYNSDLNIIERINNLKEEVINPIRQFLENVVNEHDASTILKELYLYLSEEKITDKLFMYDKKGYRKLINILGDINDYYKEYSSVSEILSLVELLYEKSKSNITMGDEVVISDIKNANVIDKKYIYLIGFDEEHFPMKYKFNTLIGEDDIKKDSLILKLEQKQEYDSYLLNRLYFVDNVYISYHKLTTESKLVNISSLINEVEKKEYELKRISNKALVISNYSLLLSENRINKLFMEEFENVNLAKKETIDENISPVLAKKLYTSNLLVSPSSIETYAKCPFYHFCLYGLKLKIKEKNIFDNREVGTFVHYILENIIKNESLNISIDNLDEKINKYALKYLEGSNKIINNTIKYIIKRLSINCKYLINNMIKEQEVVKFKPKYFEFNINDSSIVKPLVINHDNGVIRIKGIIDRVDVYEDGNNYYCRIIDYKTGGKTLRLDDCLDGLNLQMLLYLLALKENQSNLTNKNFICSAVLYYPAIIKDTLASRNMSIEEKEKSILERNKMNGIINSDNKVIELLGEENIGMFIDAVSRDKIKDDILFSNNNLELLFTYIKSKLNEIADEILSGNASVNPVMGRTNACDYCKFSSICAFDKSTHKYRKLKNYKNSEVFAMLNIDWKVK